MGLTHNTRVQVTLMLNQNAQAVMVNDIMREHVTESQDAPFGWAQKGGSRFRANNSSYNRELCSLCTLAPHLLEPSVWHLLLLLPMTSPNPVPS